MEINANRLNDSTTLPYKKGISKERAAENESKTEKTAAEQKEQYIPNSSVEQKTTYEKPKADQATIDKLKGESDRIYNDLRKIVEELLKKQGMTFSDVTADTILEVDEATRLEAQARIEGEGELSPEKVSDRIVDFAKAVSGGDASKFEVLKSAIEEGFKQAASALGGELPDISKKTYDLVMQKLNQWKEES
ncbi:hypothetical protein BK133_08430 [Paenibacillus sp. FSL H8-0548]|uniref:hypothetical protein n=1 Tax=Paenibacillus sp. FSL H8-0548 TaxID=1920422 RepID=UPI00096E6D6C|nr:hypothetical protein [Paenibacillus sp. FSL H8-0548]OMF36929.1 hypothetical protein BK133_08430 [Paenibacillus sp. FSL H8-0548]